MNSSEETAPWERLARILSTPDGSEAVQLLRQFGLLRTQEPAFRPPEPAPQVPRAIGPWEPNGNEFVRSQPWDRYLWLEERDVVAKDCLPGTFRVCWVGESVASGMFFAPGITPAKVLHAALAANKPRGASAVEVIDLSRNAMRASTLVDLCDAAGQLRPDVLLVFAGNNFCRDHTAGRHEMRQPPAPYVRAAVEGGPVGLVGAFTRSLADASRRTIAAIAESARRNETRLIWVIPANNFAWQRLGPVPILGGGRTVQWHRLFSEAQLAIADGKFARALELAQAMLELDRGAVQVTHRLQAYVLVSLNRLTEAAAHFQREIDVDAALQRPGFIAPACQSVVRDAIFEQSTKLGFESIDLVSVFAEHIGSPVLGERLFVDYCHLSIEGMQVALRAIEARLVGDCPHRRKPHSANPAVVGRGLFEAAIYTSHLHHGLEPERDAADLRNRFREALVQSDAVADAMRDYVGFRGGAVVTELSPAAHRMVEGVNTLLDFAILQWIRGIDSDTIIAICRALDDAGRAAPELLAEYLAYYRRQLAAGCDLADPRYLKSFARDGKVDWDPERGTWRTQPFLRSLWPTLPLVFAAESNTGVACRFVARLPSGRREAMVRVVVNGRLAAEALVHGRWTRTEFTIDRSLTRDGFNLIVVEWPELDETDDNPQRAVWQYQMTGSADWFPVFGELFSFHIKAN